MWFGSLGCLQRGHIQAPEVTSVHADQQGEVDGETPVMVMGSGGTWRWSHQTDPADSAQV